VKINLLFLSPNM